MPREEWNKIVLLRYRYIETPDIVILRKITENIVISG